MRACVFVHGAGGGGDSVGMLGSFSRRETPLHFFKIGSSL